MSNAYEVDCRIRDTDGFRGTVRYIGPVAAAKNKTEHWLGVEWDKQDRGKHDGSCVDESGNLHRYFLCAHGAGSFVKMSKVTNGRSLGEALSERYVGIDAPSFTKIDDPLHILPGAFVTTAKGHVKPIGFHGEHKVRTYQQLSKVDAVAVRDDTIATIEPNIKDSIGHVVEVDLQDNLLYKWSELAVLTVHVPALKTLLLHGNRMQEVTQAVADALPPLCYSGLRTLALNACNISSWASIQRLAAFLPNLEELYLSGNSLEDLPRSMAMAKWEEATGNSNDPLNTVFSGVAIGGGDGKRDLTPQPLPLLPAGSWSELRVLDLSGCNLDEWSQLLYFASLPCLEEVLLDGNPLDSISPCVAGGFPQLSRMSCSSTMLKQWSDIDAIATYSNLANLRLSHIPLFSGRGASEVRPFVIGRIALLEFFNGSTVHARERLDAEKQYLRNAIRDVDELAKAGRPLSDTALLAIHPRYNELQLRHGGELLPMGSLNAGGNIASELLSVTFNNLSFAGGGSTEPVTKKLPASITVERLKLIVKQLFNLDPNLQQLSILVYKDSPPTLLDDDQATLNYYGAQDGAKIFVNEAKA